MTSRTAAATWAVAAVVLLGACSSARPPARSAGAPTGEEVATAAGVVRDLVLAQGATVTRSTVRVSTGTPPDSNTGMRCASARLLEIDVDGSFPRIVTTGFPVPHDPAAPDLTVRSVHLTVDPATGVTCAMAVRATEAGSPGHGDGTVTLAPEDVGPPTPRAGR